MNLHFIVEKKIGTWYINFVNKFFDPSDHFFVVIGHEKFLLDNDSNVIYLQKKSIPTSFFKIRALAKKATIIHIHYLPNKIIPFYRMILNGYLKKTYWHIWGGDLYDEQSIAKKRFVKKIQAVGYIIPEDYDFFTKIYCLKKPHFQITYPSSINADTYISIFKEAIRINTAGIRLVVGNSATPENNHLKIFDYLKTVSSIDEILCPLSYGDKAYADIVIKKGKELFGDRFVPLTTFVSIEDYMKMLCGMDFGFYGYERQQGLGNVNPLILMGKKVFFFRGTLMSKHFGREYPEQVFDIENVNSIDLFSIRKPFPIHEEAIHNLYNDANLAMTWKKVFSKV